MSGRASTATPTAMGTAPGTLLEALAAALRRAAVANSNDAVPPVCVLWPDADRHWEPLLPLLRERAARGDAGPLAMPPILALGPWQEAPLTGPAFWLRCAIAGTAPDAAGAIPPGAVPVIYLPGVSRSDLRGMEECPQALQPLAELQYRGTIWSHPNGRDWTPAAFLGSEAGGLGIELRGDGATRAALGLALVAIAEELLAGMRQAAPLDAAWFTSVLNPDPVRAVLKWLDDPSAAVAAKRPEAWAAFVSSCRAEWGFDPEKDGPLSAARLLGERGGRWKDAWAAFADAPDRYPGVAARLGQIDAQPKQTALFEAPTLPGPDDPLSSWPKVNAEQERIVAAMLAALPAGDAPAARQQVLALEADHAARRAWVWAELGQSPLARALEPLAELARLTAAPIPGATLDAMASAYADHGWRADASALEALALAGSQPPETAAAIRTAVDVLSRPWLEEQALRFQALAREAGAEAFAAGPPALAPGACLLFCDGLRMDLGHRLAELVAGPSREVTVDRRLAAIPTVTPTAKPAVSPAAVLLAGHSGLDAAVAASGKKVVKEVLDEAMRGQGIQPLAPGELGDPTGRAWTEWGEIDRYGHNVGIKLARHAFDEVQKVAERVEQLLGWGWREVIVVTDHGWLLLPGGLPEATLELHLAETRKGRCARLSASASPDLPVMPWRWDPAVRIALAPGIRSFVGSPVYDHGGLSPQEAVIPVVTVRAAGAAGTASGASVAIDRLRWTGLKLAVSLSDSATNQTVDLRLRAADPSTSVVATVKQVDPDGTATLFVAADKDDLEGREAVLVVCSRDGSVLSQRETTIGGAE